MKYFVKCFFSLIILTGCGGGGTTFIQPNPFAGNWGGTWWSTKYPQGGFLYVPINNNGNCTNGTITNSQLAIQGSLTGKIETNGDFVATADYSGVKITLAGKMAFEGNNLTGSFYSSENDSGAFVLSEQ
ncbi:MAG TPA: hypothetical protein VNK96_04890 [Fimbriimonadales bacterium]|nr:hypothetical protein [Fimbriimonadales bacterium]